MSNEKNYIIVKKHLLMSSWFIQEEIKGTKKLKEYLDDLDSNTGIRIIEGHFVDLKVTVEMTKQEGCNNGQQKNNKNKLQNNTTQ